MTFIEIEDAPADNEVVTTQVHQTVKCSWCGEIIHLNGKELALAMCKDCYARMLADFVRQRQMTQTPAHASDR